VFGIFASKFAFKTLQFTGQAVVYPNELVRNLYWKMSIYENYDTRPPVSAPKNDFGASTSVGWKF
jgi:hypothetical protein